LIDQEEIRQLPTWRRRILGKPQKVGPDLRLFSVPPDRLNDRAIRALGQAQLDPVVAGWPPTIRLLYAIVLDTDSSASKLLRSVGITAEEIAIAGPRSVSVNDTAIELIFQEAFNFALMHGESLVSLEHLLAVMIKKYECAASRTVASLARDPFELERTLWTSLQGGRRE
jgi:hypothetical protein